MYLLFRRILVEAYDPLYVHNKYINIYEYVSVIFCSIYLMLGMITIYTEMSGSEIRRT